MPRRRNSESLGNRRREELEVRNRRQPNGQHPACALMRDDDTCEFQPKEVLSAPPGPMSVMSRAAGPGSQFRSLDVNLAAERGRQRQRPRARKERVTSRRTQLEVDDPVI